MPRARFVLSPEALDDLDQIWLYIAEDDIPAADRIEREIREAIKLLADRPRLSPSFRFAGERSDLDV